MKSSKASDEWLMGQVARGRREHLEVLVRRYASPLLTYIERMMGDRHRAEELFQEVFLAVWAKRTTYRFPGAFRAWLFAIATNRCRQEFRKARPPDWRTHHELSATVAIAAGPTPVEAAVGTETASLVAAAIAGLPARQRTVVVLRNYNGLEYGEIADIIGCSEATARSHMHHALGGLRRYLEPRMASDDE